MSSELSSISFAEGTSAAIYVRWYSLTFSLAYLYILNVAPCNVAGLSYPLSFHAFRNSFNYLSFKLLWFAGSKETLRGGG